MPFNEKINFILILTISTIISSAVRGDKKQDAKCFLPVEPGPCRMSLKRFYYNANTNACEEFIFGGCKGNDNKFGFKMTCEAACKQSTGVVPSVTSSTSTKQFKSDTVTGLNTHVATTTAKPVAARTTTKTLISPSKGGTTTK